MSSRSTTCCWLFRTDARQRRDPARGPAGPPLPVRLPGPHGPHRARTLRPCRGRPHDRRTRMTTTTWDSEVDLLVLAQRRRRAVGGGDRCDGGPRRARPGEDRIPRRHDGVLGGTRWVPGHRYMSSPDDRGAVASGYLDRVVGDKADRSLREAYLEHGPAMIDYMHDQGVRFWCTRRRSWITTPRSRVPASVGRSSPRPSTDASSASTTSRACGVRCSNSPSSGARSWCDAPR